MTTTNELLPCPFCGCTEIDPAEWMSETDSGPGCPECGALADSVEKWNSRRPSKPDATVREALEIAEHHAGIVYEFAKERDNGDLKSGWNHVHAHASSAYHRIQKALAAHIRAQSGKVGEWEYHRLIPCCMRDRNRDGDCDQHPQGVFVRRHHPGDATAMVTPRLWDAVSIKDAPEGPRYAVGFDGIYLATVTKEATISALSIPGSFAYGPLPLPVGGDV